MDGGKNIFNGAKNIFDAIYELYKKGLPPMNFLPSIPLPPTIAVAKATDQALKNVVEAGDNFQKNAKMDMEKKEAEIKHDEIENELLKKQLESNQPNNENKIQLVITTDNGHVEAKPTEASKDEANTDTTTEAKPDKDADTEANKDANTEATTDAATETTEAKPNKDEANTDATTETTEAKPNKDANTDANTEATDAKTNETEKKSEKPESQIGGKIQFTKEECSFF